MPPRHVKVWRGFAWALCADGPFHSVLCWPVFFGVTVAVPSVWLCFFACGMAALPRRGSHWRGGRRSDSCLQLESAYPFQTVTTRSLRGVWSLRVTPVRLSGMVLQPSTFLFFHHLGLRPLTLVASVTNFLRPGVLLPHRVTDRFPHMRSFESLTPWSDFCSFPFTRPPPRPANTRPALSGLITPKR